MTTDPIAHPILNCLNLRGQALGNPEGWGWVLDDPVVNNFVPALMVLEKAGLIRLDSLTRQQAADRYWEIAARWVRREHQLIGILDSFSAAGLQVAPLKGAVLLGSLYQRAGLRNMCDIDILVQPHDFLAAVQILLGQGMRFNGEEEGGSSLSFTSLPTAFWPGELTFINGQGLQIDLHQSLVTYHWFKIAFPLEIDQVWARSQTADPTPGSQDQAPALSWPAVLSPYDMLAHLVLHLALHGLSVIKNFLDVDLWFRNLPAGWDWNTYIAIAEDWQLRSSSFHTFTFCQALFNTPVPCDILKQLDPGAVARWQVRRLVTPRALIENRRTLGIRYPTLVKLALFDHPGVKWRSLHHALFPGRSWLRHHPDYSTLFGHWMHLYDVVSRGD